jgi:primosomal protein N' (replication factor Y)
VRIVDTSAPGLGERAQVLSRELAERLREAVAAGRQAILLHNRRGYAARLRCERCGLIVGCERCGAWLVYHRAAQQLRCHRCGLRRLPPPHCLDDTCGGNLRLTGLSIQRLEEELQRELPNARLLRFDRDVARKLSDYERALRRFAEGEADVLLGTQMVAKGLDFPNVGLVGVIDADAHLNAPDFRAAERTFQLVAQVVGRAGRREGDSLAVIQANDARHPVLLAAADLDYERFARGELPLRESAGLPPFSRLARLVCADPDRARARAQTEALVSRLREIAARLHAGLLVEDASECVMPRLRELFRYDTLIRAPKPGLVQRLLNEAESAKALRPRVRRMTIDVDPLEML